MPPIRKPETFLNKKHNKLTIIEDAGIIKKCRRVIAKCECGNIKMYRLPDIENGGSTNCGCVRSEGLIKRNAKHMESCTKLYRSWKGMIERCTYEKHQAYKWYGGRGIYVCQEWMNNFLTFKEWAIKNGYKLKLHIDRINTNGPYAPNNCRIVTPKANARNKRNNNNATYKGVTKCIAAWAEEYKLKPSLLYHRINHMKWDIEKALTTKTNFRYYAD